jgi:glutathione S-transferase
MYSLSLACGVAEKLFGLDLLAELPTAKALLERLHAMPNALKVAADREAAMPAFMAMVAAKK